MTTRTTLSKLRSTHPDEKRGKVTARSRASATDALRALYRTVKEHRIAKDEAEQGAKDATREAIALADQFDMRESAITFELNGALFVGTIVSPKGSDTWNVEKVVEYAHKKNIWENVSTRVFDQDKWEAEVSSGNVVPSEANKLRVPGTPKTPYVSVTKK